MPSRAMRRLMMMAGGGGAAPAIPWYLAGGIDPASVLAIYRPAGAATYAASLSNIANPGTNDAEEGAAPAWTANGWVLDGVNDYLKGPAINCQSGTMIIRSFYNANDDGCLVGWSSDDFTNKFYITQDAMWKKLRFNWGAGAGSLSSEITYTASHNTVALSSANCYINGAKQAFTPATPPGNKAVRAYIGAQNAPAGASLFLNIGVEFAAFYSAILTDAQIAAVETAWLNF